MTIPGSFIPEVLVGVPRDMVRGLLSKTRIVEGRRMDPEATETTERVEKRESVGELELRLVSVELSVPEVVEVESEEGVLSTVVMGGEGEGEGEGVS